MGHLRAARAKPLAVGLVAVGLASWGLTMPSDAAPAPSGTDVTLTSGTGVTSEWYVQNDQGTSNGLPAGGSCPGTPAPGLGLDDAEFDVAGVDQGDAFDGGLMFFVNNVQMVAPTNWDVQADATNASLNRVLTAGPTAVGGVNATVEYRALPNQQVLRSTVYLTNPGSTATTVPLTVATNVGSDGGTVLVASSSGDTTFSDADRWLVTSDDAATPGDAVNTHVFGGPGAVASPPTATSTTVFDCAATNGVQATYNVTIPAGGTRAVMLFNELSGTNETATASAARFSQTPGAADELLTGLSTAQRASIVNWRLVGAQPDAVIRKSGLGYIGNNVYNKTARRQTVRDTAGRGDVRTFRVRIANDGRTRATFAVHGVQSAQGIRVQYFTAGGKNVTAAMTSAAGLSVTRSPGRHQRITVRVTIGKHASVGARKFVKVVATGSAAGAVKVDAVKAVVMVTG